MRKLRIETFGQNARLGQPLQGASRRPQPSERKCDNWGNQDVFWAGMSANPVVDAVVSTVQCATSGCDPVTYSMTVLPGPSPVTISNAADDLADAVNTIDNLPDNALVCRGGTCIAERFETGAGVTLNADGTMTGVSVNSASGASLDELTVTIPNGQVGVTTVGDVRLAGGNVIPDPLLDNPYHSLLNGITSTQAEKLLTPTIPNPHRLRGR